MDLETNSLNNWLNLSQFEMSGWELIPVALVLLFLIGGCAHLIKAHRNSGALFREKRQEHARKKMDLPMIIDTPATQAFSVRTYDISLGGAFIPLSEMKKAMNFTSFVGKRSGIKVGDIIDLKLQTGRFSYIQCQGKVVRLGPAGDQSEGLGIKFIEMRWRDQKKLETLLYHEVQKVAS